MADPETFTDIAVKVPKVPGQPPTTLLLCYCDLCGLLVGSRKVHLAWHAAEAGESRG